MSTTYISTELRRTVIERAQNCCEYCLMNTDNTGINFAIDHIIAEKHGGQTIPANLCLSCFRCNSFKGSDIASVDWDNNGLIQPLFNPRQDKWSDHFNLDNSLIQPLTGQGRVTVFLLRLNAPERLEERLLLIDLGVYPCDIGSFPVDSGLAKSDQ